MGVSYDIIHWMLLLVEFGRRGGYDSSGYHGRIVDEAGATGEWKQNSPKDGCLNFQMLHKSQKRQRPALNRRKEICGKFLLRPL